MVGARYFHRDSAGPYSRMSCSQLNSIVSQNVKRLLNRCEYRNGLFWYFNVERADTLHIPNSASQMAGDKIKVNMPENAFFSVEKGTQRQTKIQQPINSTIQELT